MKLPPFVIAAALGMLSLSMLPGCKSTKPGPEAPDKAAKDSKEATDAAKKDAKPGDKPADASPVPAAPGSAEASAIDIAFLLSMSYAEAKTLSANFLEIPPFYKIAADEIEITKKNEDGSPSRVRAKGRVFVEMSYLEPAKALCQELLLNPEELILRGKPVLQRGNSTVEGVDDYTIFYMFGTRLRVIGPHRLTNPDQLAASVDASGLPTLGAWSSAPNPLLPPLTEGAVPDMIRLEAQQAAEAEALHQKARTDYGPPTLLGPATPPESPKKTGAAPKDAPPKSKTETAPAPEKGKSPPKTPESSKPAAKVETAVKDAKTKAAETKAKADDKATKAK